MHRVVWLSLLWIPAPAWGQDAEEETAAGAETQEEAAPEGPDLAALGDDAPLEAFVAQRRAIEGRDEGGQRAVFALPALGAVAEAAAGFLADRARAEIEWYGAQVLREQLCSHEKLRDLLDTACEVLEGFEDTGSTGTGRLSIDTLVAALEADLARAAEVVIRLAIEAVADGAERARLGLASLAEILEGVRLAESPVELADRLFRVALSCDTTGAGTDATTECQTPDGKSAQRALLRRANVLIWALNAPVEDDDALRIANAGGERADAARRAVARLTSVAREHQRTARWVADPDPGADADRRREMREALGALSVSLVFAANDVVSPPADRAAARTRDRAKSAVGAAVAATRAGDASAVLAATLRVVSAGKAWSGGADEAGAVTVPRFAVTALSTAAALATADDADAARAVLDQVSAPVASWRAKRHGFLLSLTGLFGAAGMHDILASDGDFMGSDKVEAYAFGLHASVGLDLNLLGGAAGTLGFYVPFVDFGSLASVPFGRDAEQLESNGSLLSVLSPGLFLRFGIAQSPLVLAGGATFVPEARSRTIDDGMGGRTTEDLDAFRFSITLAVDTTLWVF